MLVVGGSLRSTLIVCGSVCDCLFWRVESIMELHSRNQAGLYLHTQQTPHSTHHTQRVRARPAVKGHPNTKTHHVIIAHVICRLTRGGYLCVMVSRFGDEDPHSGPSSAILIYFAPHRRRTDSTQRVHACPGQGVAVIAVFGVRCARFAHTKNCIIERLMMG